jgi:hypothetical protein
MVWKQIIIFAILLIIGSSAHAWSKPKNFIALWSEKDVSGVCVAKKNGNWDNGNPIHFWSCEGSQDNLRWSYDPISKKIMAVGNPSKCIAKKSKASGSGWIFPTY